LVRRRVAAGMSAQRSGGTNGGGGRHAPPTQSGLSSSAHLLPSAAMATVAPARMGRLDDLGKLVALCKRRGFVFQSAEIYGGFANTYDYGPLGTLLKNNVRDAWIRANVQRRDDVELIDAALITSPKVWIASGHVAEFNDP